MTSPRLYPSDLSDAEWALIEPFIPPPRSGGPDGGRPATDRRAVVNAISYLVRTGCSWRQLPRDFPAWQTVYGYHKTWAEDGTLERIHEALRDQVRAAEGREPEPTAGIVDAQSVKGADTVGAGTRGYDAGKKTNGRKRHVVVDTMGMVLALVVTAANVQDRDGGRLVIEEAVKSHGQLTKVWADGGYAGKLVDWAVERLDVDLEIVRKREGQRTFEVLPRRWVVERTLSWVVKCRRLVADYERKIEHSLAMVRWAMIGLMGRRLARKVSDDVTAYNWE
ncbi:MAG: IS5 family transposase [Acidimicrobiales bacterium]